MFFSGFWLTQFLDKVFFEAKRPKGALALSKDIERRVVEVGHRGTIEVSSHYCSLSLRKLVLHWMQCASKFGCWKPFCCLVSPHDMQQKVGPMFSTILKPFLCFCLLLHLEKAMIRFGYSYAGMVENLMPAHQAGGNTQGVGMPQISFGFSWCFCWSPNEKCVADKNALVLDEAKNCLLMVEWIGEWMIQWFSKFCVVNDQISCLSESSRVWYVWVSVNLWQYHHVW